MSSWLVRSLALALIGFASVSSSRAWAALGQREETVESDPSALAGTRRVDALGRFFVHEIRTPSGTAVREFAAHGTVFAVAWDGPFLPDLRQILGEYGGLVAAARKARRGHGPLTIHTPELVLESSGHMRGFRGRAYLPAKVPGDVPVTELH